MVRFGTHPSGIALRSASYDVDKRVCYQVRYDAVLPSAMYGTAGEHPHDLNRTPQNDGPIAEEDA